MGIKIISNVVAVFWFVVLLMSVVGKLTYHAPDAEPLDFALSQGVYNVFILIAAMGLLSSVLLSLSLCTFKSTLKIFTLGVSVLTNILFYLFIVLLFVVNKNPIFIALFLWIFCAVACIVLLIKEKGGTEHEKTHGVYLE